jgi:hypothetical protein
MQTNFVGYSGPDWPQLGCALAPCESASPTKVDAPCASFREQVD